MTMYVNPTGQETQQERLNAEAALAERRRAERMKRKFVTQMTPWAPGVPSVPVEVIIEDISDAGVGLVHDHEIPLGLTHLLNVPRGDEGKSIIQEYVVVRCDRRYDGKYTIGLELSLNRSGDAPEPKRVCSKRLKTLFLLFGIFGLIIASLAPL